MMNVPKQVWLAGSLALIPFLGAWDESPEKHAKWKMDKYDKNKDGKITREEWGGEKDQFQAADRDKSGALNSEELVQYFREQNQKQDAPAGKFEDADLDRDRKVNWDEWKRFTQKDRIDRVAAAFFEKMDADKDKTISKAEQGAFFRTFEKFLLEKFPDKKGSLNSSFETADQDKDGCLSWEEWKKYVAAREESMVENVFGMLDKNKDKVLKLDEWDAFFKEFRKFRNDMPLDPQDDKAMAKLEEEIKKRIDFVMKEYDRNGDGKLSQEEWDGDVERFDEWDKSGDGYLSRDELMSYFRATFSKQTQQK